MSKLSLYLLGAPQIVLDDKTLSVGHNKGIALLAYLAMSKQAHTRESLATFLWPEHDTSSGLGEVRRMLWALNKALGKGWILADRQTITLNPDADVWMDVNHFQDLISSYTQHKHAASEVCSRCLEPLGEALALVKGDFLAGFSLTDSSSFDDWQAEQTDALRNDFSRVLQKLIIINLNDSTQEAQETMRYARRWLSLDPLHEPAHRLLMGLYASNNQSSAATKQYQDCVDVLSKELNIEPEQETVSLFKRIRQGSFDAANDLETLPFNFIAASPNKTPGSNNLPVQIMPFIGRDFELTALTGLLNDSQFSMVSIVAPGGMGKTRLALELGKKMLPHFKDGVFLVELAPISEGTTIIPAIAEATGYQFQSDGGNQKQQLLAYLANKELLLILDNFEHLLDNADLVTELIRAAPGIKLLITSRQRLNQAGETLFTLHGISLPDAQHSVTEASRSPALELFQHIARQARPDFALSSDNLTAVIQICQLLEGMPLGILLAAPWVTVLSAAEIVEELQAGLDILEAEGSNLPERLRSMRAVLDQSWNMLDENEQQVFMKLALFKGGFTREAGQKIANAGLRQLQSLITKGLVERNNNSKRFHVHELLRQYAEEKLHQSGDQETQVKHTTFYLTFLSRMTPDLKHAKQLETLKCIEADFDNVREAWERALSSQNYDKLGAAIEGMYLFCLLQARLEDGKALFEKARQRLCQPISEQPHPVCLALSIRFYNTGDDHTVILDRLKSSLEQARERNDLFEAAYSLHTLATLAHYVKQDPLTAISYYEECANLYRQLDEHYYLAQTLSKLGEACHLAGQMDRTLDYIHEARQLQRDIGDKMGEAETLRALGMTAYLNGDYDAVYDFLLGQHELNLEMNYRLGTATSSVFIGLLFFHKGAFSEGNIYLEQALDLAHELADYSTQAWALTFTSFNNSILGKPAEAEADLLQAEAIETDPFNQTGAGNPFLDLQIAFTKAYLTCHTGNYNAVRKQLRQPLQMTLATNAHPYMILTITLSVVLYARNNQAPFAVELLGLAESSSTWIVGWLSHWLLLNQVREELKTELGEDAFNAAYERGKTLGFRATTEKVLQAIEEDLKDNAT